MEFKMKNPVMVNNSFWIPCRLLAKARMLARPLGQNILMGQDVGSWAMAMAHGHAPWSMGHSLGWLWAMAMGRGPWPMAHG